MRRFFTHAGRILAATGLLMLILTADGAAAAVGDHTITPTDAAVAQTVDGDDAIPRWHGNGVVRVTKLITGDDVPSDIAFDICLTGPLPDGPQRCKTMTGAGTITFHDLVPGTYTIAERDVPPGFEVTYSATELVVVKNQFTDVTVTNHYPPPAPAVGRAEVTKVVTGDDAPSDVEYEICLTGPLPDGGQRCGIVVGSGTVEFDDLEPGTYTVAEQNVGAEVDVTYSTTEIEIVAGETATATVTNAYPAAPPDVGRVEVTKVVTGDAPDDAVFEVCLTGPLPDDSVRCDDVVADGTVAFDDLTPGTYLLSETAIAAEVEVTYSDAEIDVIAGETASATVTNAYPERVALPPTPPTTSPPSTTPPPTTTVPPEVSPETETKLPATGGDVSTTLASMLVVSGAALVLLARRPGVARADEPTPRTPAADPSRCSVAGVVAHRSMHGSAPRRRPRGSVEATAPHRRPSAQRLPLQGTPPARRARCSRAPGSTPEVREIHFRSSTHRESVFFST